MSYLRGLVILMVLGSGATSVLSSFEAVRFEFELSSGLQSPIDVAVTPGGDVLVLDSKTLKVSQFSRDGSLVRQYGGKGLLDRPVAIAAGPSGQVAIADQRRQMVMLFDELGELTARFGGSGTDSGEFKKLVDVEFDHFGFIYAADAGRNTVSRFSDQGVLLGEAYFVDQSPSALSVDRAGRITLLVGTGPEVLRFNMDDASGAVTRLRFDTRPSGAGGVYIDNHGDLYVTRSKKNNVLKFASDGELLASFGSRGKGPGAFSGPTRISGDGQGEVYVVDGRNARIQAFSLEGAGNGERELPLNTKSAATVQLANFEPLNESVDDLVLLGHGEQLRLFGASSRILRKGLESAVLGEPGKRPGQFRAPRGVAALPDGRLVVADTGNNRLQIMDTGGSFSVVGERGNEPGFFRSPTDVAVNSQGLVYVTDSGNARVQIFTDQGIYMHSFGTRGERKKGSPAPMDQFAQPTSLAIDVDDHVHVLDTGNKRVVSFNSRGEALGQISGFNTPVDLAVDKHANLYVADNGCHCVRVYARSGEKLLRFGGAGTGAGQLGAISAIATADGRVMIADGAARPDILSAALAGLAGKRSKSSSAGAIKSFDVMLQGVAAEERISITHRYYIPESIVSQPEQMSRYRELALDESAAELAALSGRPQTLLRGELRVDSERVLAGGEVVLVVSIAARAGGSGDEQLAEDPEIGEPEEDEVELAF